MPLRSLLGKLLGSAALLSASEMLKICANAHEVFSKMMLPLSLLISLLTLLERRKEYSHPIRFKGSKSHVYKFCTQCAHLNNHNEFWTSVLYSKD